MGHGLWLHWPSSEPVPIADRSLPLHEMNSCFMAKVLKLTYCVGMVICDLGVSFAERDEGDQGFRVDQLTSWTLIGR
jgi:hypothetical protein